MLAPHTWTILWPGLSRLWLRGDIAGLGIACMFAAMLNGLLITTFLWPRIIGTGDAVVVFNIVGWFVVLCFWGASAWTAWRIMPQLRPNVDTHGDDALLLRAQTEYLRGHWYEAEKLLAQMLRASPRDADAHLLMASLYRHTRRYDEARKALAWLEHLEGGAKWRFEIGEERRRLADQERAGPQPGDAGSDETQDGEEPDGDTQREGESQRTAVASKTLSSAAHAA
jgi:hypothetical protein